MDGPEWVSRSGRTRKTLLLKIRPTCQTSLPCPLIIRPRAEVRKLSRASFGPVALPDIRSSQAFNGELLVPREVETVLIEPLSNITSC